MKETNGYWFPDEETHMFDWVNERGGYQTEKQDTAFALCKKRGVAIDIGAHVGTWARPMKEIFHTVVCFEPVFYEYLEKNVPGAIIHKVALSDKHEYLKFTPGENSTGDTHVGKRFKEPTEGAIEATTLDKFGYLPDFIKMDCEGFEYFVIKGGERMIKESKPVMVVEQKPKHSERFGIKQGDAIRLLESWGAKVVVEYSGDFFLRW